MMQNYAAMRYVRQMMWKNFGKMGWKAERVRDWGKMLIFSQCPEIERIVH